MLGCMAKIKRIEKIRKDKTMEEEFNEEIEREIMWHYEISPLIKRNTQSNFLATFFALCEYNSSTLILFLACAAIVL